MLSILIIFIKFLILVLAISAFCGVLAFFKDLRNFKSEKQMSLPRRKLIQAILDEQTMTDSSETAEVKDGEVNAI